LASSQNKNKSHVDRAIEYAKKAVADTKGKTTGKWIRLAAKRFLCDLKRAKVKTCHFTFSPEEAEKACEFIELMPHVEGKWDKETIVLHPAQSFFVVQLFGFRNRKTGFRRFTSALYATARKSGKSTLAAAILLYCLCCEDEIGAQVLSAATTYPQASIIWGVAKKMVDKMPELRDAFGLETWAKSISRLEAGSCFKAIHAKASSQDGLNPSHTALDEIHAHKTADLLNVLTSAAGARANPLWLYTTTEGYASPGPWSEIRIFAKKLLEGVFGNDADHFLALFWAVDDEDNEFDEGVWIKANPLIDVNPHLLEAIRKEATEAKHMPSKLTEFRIKRLNRPASVAEGWIDLVKWQACGEGFNLDDLRSVPCYGGLDLASTSDFASFRLVWEIGEKIYTAGWRWCPESAVNYRTERGTVPYQAWVTSGLLKQTEGDIIDYNVIEADILSLMEVFNIRAIGYDRWNATDLVNRLVAGDAPMVEFVQGAKSYHPAMQKLERKYISGQLAHGGDPILNWCASNIVAKRNENLNMSPDKKKSADKIDDMVALLMAVGMTVSPEETEPEYDIFFV